MTDRYIELHARSAFSFLEGGSLPEQLIERAAALEMPSMALLDRNGVYGAARFHTSAKRNGVRAHIGAEISVASLGSRLMPPAWLPHQYAAEPARLSLLSESREGYRHLCQLITQFKMRETTKNEGAATLEDLRQYASGLICLTGGDEGPLAAALVNGGEEAGREMAERLISIFGRQNVYIELQRHQEREEEWRNQAAIRIARSLKLPVIATNGVCYALAYDREILDLFTAIRHHMEIDRAGRLLAVNSQHFLRTAREMAALFRDVPGAVENTVDLASRLKFELNDLGYEFPRYPVPGGETMDTFLRKRVAEGVERRYGPKNNRELLERARKQVEHELALIARLGFAGYFLIVWDIVQYCKRNGILIQGRGSAANSAVCYALEITAIDPVGMDLLFERFLSESRGEWPDIDLDLPSEEKREQAIRYVYRRYGELGAAMTANVIAYRGKSAAREVGKALGLDSESLGRLASLSQWEWHGKTDTMARSFQNAGFDIRHPRIAKYLELSMRIQDLPRHLGQHSGGMVICQGQLNCVVPLERASMPGRTVVQWDKEDCADLGIIKVDLLGLGMMAVLKDCLELIPEHYGRKIDLAQLPEDEEVYRTLQRADTIGMFQIESRAQMASLPRNNPEKFYDLVVQVAIVRPGPIVGKMMNPYMLRRQEKEEISYPHPSLEPVLHRTLGVPLFQEQLLRMAMTVANFSAAEADELRRAVGMRRSWERMKNLEGKLRAGMTANGMDSAMQEHVVQYISSFALYGFPESHAASFALIAYASAYFKVKYLAAFTCAILNHQPMGFYSPAVLVKDAQRHGLRVKPIDVQVSDWPCTVEHESDGSLSLRMGLGYAKGLRRQSAEALVASRMEGGPFRSTEDLALRVSSLNRKELTLLVRIGALNRIHGIAHRRDALWQVERAGKLEGPLLRQQSEWLKEDDSETLPLRQMSTEERLVADYAGTGLTTGKHPMHYRRSQLRRRQILSAGELRACRDGEFVRTAGCVIARQRPGTAKGFIFLSIEDETGIANVIVTPALYDRDRLMVTRSKFLLVEGPLQNQDGVIHVKAVRLTALLDSALELRSHDFH